MASNIPGHVLYLADDLVGDVLVALDGLRGIREALPDCHLVVSARPALHDLLACCPEINDLVAINGLDVYKGFDIVFNTRYDRESFELVRDLDSVRSFGFECIGANQEECEDCYTKYVPLSVWTDEFKLQGVHATLGTLISLAFPAYTASPPKLVVPAALKKCMSIRLAEMGLSARDYVVHFPGSNAPNRRWPLERFLALAASCKQSIRHVFLFGPAEKDLLQQSGDVIRRHGHIVIDDLTLAEVAALFSLARAAVCDDSGPMHISASVGCPTVAIFSSGVSACWFPYARDRNRVVQNTCATGLVCHTCKQLSVCAEKIRVEPVVLSLEHLLSM